jgi:hypothetical protein
MKRAAASSGRAPPVDLVGAVAAAAESLRARVAASLADGLSRQPPPATCDLLRAGAALADSAQKVAAERCHLWLPEAELRYKGNLAVVGGDEMVRRARVARRQAAAAAGARAQLVPSPRSFPFAGCRRRLFNRRAGPPQGGAD